MGRDNSRRPRLVGGSKRLDCLDSRAIGGNVLEVDACVLEPRPSAHNRME